MLAECDLSNTVCLGALDISTKYISENSSYILKNWSPIDNTHKDFQLTKIINNPEFPFSNHSKINVSIILTAIEN